MEGLAKWLADITWPLVTRVLSALGLGTMTYLGADSALGTALSFAKGALGGLTADVAALLAMAGWFDFMSITSGGIVSGLAWLVMKRFALQTTGSGS